MHNKTMQCKQAAYTAILNKSGKGRQRNMYAYMKGIPRFSRSAWAENIANAWLPIQTWEKLQRAVTSFLRCESKFFQVKSLVSTHSVCPCKNYVPKYSQTPHELDYLVISLFTRSGHTKQKKLSRNHHTVELDAFCTHTMQAGSLNFNFDQSG